MERPLRPEEASLEQGAYLAGPQGQFACHHRNQVHSSSVWARLTRPPKKCKKAGTQSRACTSNTGGPQPTAVAHTGQTRRAWVVISGSVGGCSGSRPVRTPLPLRVGAWGGRGVHLQAQVDNCTSAPGALLAGGRSSTQSRWGYYGAPSTSRFGQGCHQFVDRVPRLQCVGGGPLSPRRRKGHWGTPP